MRKFIYSSIIEKLKTMKNAEGEQTVRHFDLWNNNLEYIEEEQPFYTPAVFVEFQPIAWQHQGSGVREAAVNAILHVITQRNMPTSNELPYSQLSLEFFDLLTDINRCLHGHAKADEQFVHDSITAVQSATDHDCGELRHDIEIFACHALDMSAKPVMPRRSVTAQFTAAGFND